MKKNIRSISGLIYELRTLFTNPEGILSQLVNNIHNFYIINFQIYHSVRVTLYTINGIQISYNLV